MVPQEVQGQHGPLSHPTRSGLSAFSWMGLALTPWADGVLILVTGKHLPPSFLSQWLEWAVHSSLVSG